MELRLRDDKLSTNWSESYSIKHTGLTVGEVVINEHPDMYIIWKLNIVEQLRNIGLGRKLMSILPKDKKIRLAVSKENKIAINLYTKSGFKEMKNFNKSKDYIWMERKKNYETKF